VAIFPRKALHTRKKALYLCKRDLHSAKEPYIAKHESNPENIQIHAAICIGLEEVNTRKRALYARKRALYLRKRALYLRKRALFLRTSTQYFCKRALHLRNRVLRIHRYTQQSALVPQGRTFGKEPYISAIGHHISAKEPYISVKYS